MLISITLGSFIAKITVSAAVAKSIATVATAATCYGGAKLVKNLLDDND